MAGRKKSRAGDAVGRRAKRAGVPELSLLIPLEKSSRMGYDKITNSYFLGGKQKIGARLWRNIWREQEFILMDTDEFGGWARRQK